MNPSGEQIVELVQKAQLDCQESMRKLAELAEERMRAYLYRITLDFDVAEDLVQETMLQMVKSLKSLKNPQSYWAWLYRIALGKAQHHFRSLKKHRKVKHFQDSDLESISPGDNYSNGLTGAMREELARAIFDGINDMKFEYRNVLVLRCFEQKPYSEISKIMDCSKATAQVWFFRAKQTLKKGLVRKGFAKAMMLTGLGLFGKMTTPAEASFATVVVTGESIKTSILTSAISAITTKLGMTIMAIALTAGMGTFYTLYSVKNNEQLNGLNLPERNSVRSFHYVEQAWNNTAETNPNLSRGRSLSKGAYEQWFYFPEGLDGAMFMMMQRWDPMMESKLCSWMQNSKGNYYFHSGNETIHINNYNLPLRDLRVRRLPTDSVEFTRFLDSIEGKTKGISYERDKKTGFLIGSLDNRFYNAGNFRNSISYNHLDEEDFTSFRYSWPVDACVVDERDAMHKRGWTFYKIRGLTGNCPIYGRGRIPFVYEKYNEYCPWVELAIGDNCTIIDNNKQCYASDAGGKVTTIYVPGTFLKAFSRPWMGMHTIDLIRREAAKEKIRFKTRQKLLSENIAVVTLHFDNYGYTTVVGYEINLEKDLIKQISFNATDTAGEMRQGYIYFEYTEGVEENPDYFSPPLFHETSTSTNHYNNSSLSWLAELAQGKLVK